MRTIAVGILLALSAGAAAQAQVVAGEEPNRGGEMNLVTQDPQAALEHLVPQEGYEVSLFASEQDFPIGNPVSMTFDARGRLWVVTMPSYPQRLPGTGPDDKIIILEDSDHDGKADTHTVFIDGLHVPTGFELGDGGAYIAQQPNIIFARDTDGDDVADEREVILHGFGTEDSHHSISAFTWGPGGGLYFQEGTFHHSQVETPWGPVRLFNAGIFRYKPDMFRLDVFVTYGFANPWGHVFDRWGQNFVADASGGSNYFGTAFSGHKPYPDKSSPMKVFTSVVRPTAGCEIVSSRHFPDEAQGNFLVNNCIGFQGIKQHRMIEEDSGFTSEEIDPLLYSTDINFRPVDIQFGPDGALYIVDWFNPLVGHMQYSLRDERRDHSHGRIWRITHKNKPLLDPVNLEALNVPELLDQLKAYEDRTRYRTRGELRNRPKDAVLTALDEWVKELDRADAAYEHHVLEALWVKEQLSSVDHDLLVRVLNSSEAKARAAATRVVRNWRHYLEDAPALLARSVNDLNPRVRLEAVVALSYIDSFDSALIALQALNYPMDYYLDYALNETLDTLTDRWQPGMEDGALANRLPKPALEYLVSRTESPILKRFAPNETVYTALLERHNVTDRARAAAMKGLAELRGTAALDEVLAAMGRVGAGENEHKGHALVQLGELLLEITPSELAAKRDAIAALTQHGHDPAIRQSAYGALMTADGDPAAAWTIAAQQPGGLEALLGAAPELLDAGLRDAVYPRIVAVLTEDAGDAPDDTDAPARFVRIGVPGDDRVLTLAEVEVFEDGRNVARAGTAQQSSVGHGGVAGRGIDGNKRREYSQNGQTHTQSEANPWWELDLGGVRRVARARVWNRAEGDTGARLDGFTLTLLDENRTPVYTQENIAAPARYADIQVVVDPQQAIRDAAIAAIAGMGGHGGATFTRLADFVAAGKNVDASIRALNQLPEEDYPDTGLAELGGGLVGFVEGLPPAERTTPAAQDAFALGEKLAARMPGTDAASLRARLGKLGTAIAVIRPVPHKMVYDRTEFWAEAGSPVEILFENIDIMPHNLVITVPGARERVGMAADALALVPGAEMGDYIPETDEVLFHTALLHPGQNETLRFTAPDEPGDYPYVCTFPGHWLIMYGTMHVAAELGAEQKRAAATALPLAEGDAEADARDFVKLWTLEDLLPEIAQAKTGRNLERGAELFEAAGCNKCHVFDGAGLGIGPELTTIGEKYPVEELIRQIVVPSSTVEEQYITWLIDTSDFESHAGFIVEQDEEKVVLRGDINDPEAVTVIPRGTIDTMVQSPLSTMPTGLLSTLSQDEIYDLLAYLYAGGSNTTAASTTHNH